MGGQSHPDIEPRIINVNYTDDQAGLPIKEEDTIRARNGVWYTQEECSDFRNKSFLRCPTYGNCNRCWVAGPVNKFCRLCNKPDCGYAIVMVPDYRWGTRIIDAEYLSKLFGQDIHNEVAIADRKESWIRDRTMRLEFQHIFSELTYDGFKSLGEAQKAVREIFN